MLGFHFEIETKSYIFKVILSNYAEEKYRSIGYFSVNTHWNVGEVKMAKVKIEKDKMVKTDLSF